MIALVTIPDELLICYLYKNQTGIMIPSKPILAKNLRKISDYQNLRAGFSEWNGTTSTILS